MLRDGQDHSPIGGRNGNRRSQVLKDVDGGGHQVLAWWATARAAGARAVVTEMITGAGALLVGLEVTGTPMARQAGGAAQRWQALTLRGGRIVDIPGFDDRAAAAGRAGVPV
jgi:hypothetical protein